MKVTPDCYPCAFRQARRVYDLAAAENGRVIPPWENVEPRIREILSKDWSGFSPAEISCAVIHAVMEEAGCGDPFATLKKHSNEVALSHLPEVRQLVREAADPLRKATELSVAGNIIDLGIKLDFDLRESVDRVTSRGFAIDHYDRYQRKLSGAKRIFVAADNSGEIVFDRVLVETLKETFPGVEVTVAVNQDPVLNDALMEDAVVAGMHEVARVIDNGYGDLGSLVEKASDEFKEAYFGADVIISKGQANFETLEDRPEEIFLLLQAKCDAVARHVGVRFHDAVLISTRERLGLP